MSKKAKTTTYFTNITSGIDNIRFDLTNVDTSLANALRRCILSEVPVYGFEDEPKHVFGSWKNAGIAVPKGIHITENTTSLHNEFLAHRIGLIPVYCNRPITSEFNEEIFDRVFYPTMNVNEIRRLESKLATLPLDSAEREEVELELTRQREMPLFKIDITNNKKTRGDLESGAFFSNLGRKEKRKISTSSNNIVSVTSDMFHTRDGDELNYIKYDPTIYANFDGRTEYPVLVTLKPGIGDEEGQSLKANVRPNPGIARYHSKYCPVGTVSYSFKRDEDPKRIRTYFLRLLEETNRTREMKGLEPHDTDVFDSSGEIRNDLHREVMKIWNNFQILDRDKIYELDGSSPKYYEFNVESVGSLEPGQTVHDALYMLRLKCIDVFTHTGGDSEYVTIDRSSGVMKAVDIVLLNENHTLGNVITSYLNTHPSIDFAGYKMPHPLDERVVFRVTLKESSDIIGDATAVFKDSLMRLINDISDLIEDWRSNVKVYDRLNDTTTTKFLEEGLSMEKVAVDVVEVKAKAPKRKNTKRIKIKTKRDKK